MASIDLKRSSLWGQPAVPSAPLSAIHHIRRMRGGTQPHLMLAADGRRYVVKFQNNPVHPRILANEWLATRIARLLGLPMPQVSIIEVSDWLISHTPKLRMQIGERLVPCSGRLQLASLYAADPDREEIAIEHLPKTLRPRLANRVAFALALPFDKWAGNFVTGWRSFEPLLSRLESLDAADLWNIAVEVPQEWYQHDASALARLIETLHKRRSLIRDLITRFRRSERHPFPSWRG